MGRALADLGNQHTGIANNASTWSNSSIVQDYKEEIAYDANGNILTYFRNGTTAGGKLLAMDNLSYRYLPNSNKLDHVSDTVTASNYTEDIDNQDTLNYTYDAIGNLTKDVKEGIDTITWTVYGKINSITKANGTVINYGYDAAGNRIVKTVNATGMGTVNTFYVRDAQGNTMSVYADSAAAGLKLNEQHVYGSSRLGMYTWGKAILATAPVPQWLGGSNYTKVYDSILPGSMSYELSNHLGNVLSVISDKKIGLPLNDTTVAYYVAEVLSQNDYYPFGMMMPGRKYDAGNLYRYGFNGKENDNEVKDEGNQQDYGMRIYDTRLGRFLSVDPLIQSYPFYTPYQFAGNTPILFIDLDGGEPKDYIARWQELFAEGNKVGNDPVLGPVNVKYVHDIVTKQYWFVTQSNDQYYYWRHNDGAKSNELINKNNISNGNWIPFKTYNQIEREIINELVDGAATSVFAIAALGAGVSALPGTFSFLSARASDPSSWASAASDYSAQRLSGKSNSQVNKTSVIFNWLIPGGGTIKSEIIAAASIAVLSSGLEYSSKQGFRKSLLGDKSIDNFLIESFNDASGNYLGGKFGGKAAKYLQHAASDKVAHFGLGVFGNFVPDLIINGASNSASENQKEILDSFNK